MLSIHFLSAADGTPLTKRFDLDEDGKLRKQPYPQVYHVTSHEAQVDVHRGLRR